MISFIGIIQYSSTFYIWRSWRVRGSLYNVLFNIMYFMMARQCWLGKIKLRIKLSSESMSPNIKNLLFAYD